MRSYFLPDQPFSTVVTNMIPNFRVGWLPFMDDPDNFDQFDTLIEDNTHRREQELKA